MAGRKVGYIYRKESDLDDSLRVNRIVLGIDTSNSISPPAENDIKFAKVTLIRDNTDSKQAKAIEVQYNATTRTDEVPDEPIIYDSENITDDRTTSDIYSREPLAVGDVIELTSNDDKSDLLQWMVRQSGGGGITEIYVEVISANNANSYNMQQFDNPVDLNAIGDPFIALAIEHVFGTLTATASGKGKWINQKPDGKYYLDLSLFYGS